MSEIKRATLMSFGADKCDEKKEKVPVKSVRLTFVLPESNESTCPVYNYKEELAAAKKKDRVKNGGKPTNGLDPFDEDDEDVKRIAMEMEAKYGAGPPTKKRQKRRDDYADIGMGYDESDSFIDNTDGYDEMIPQNVTPLHGGFYINCGALEFKTDEAVSSEGSSSSSASSDEDDDDEEKPSRKRVLESSDSEGDTETEKANGVEKAGQCEKKPKLQESSQANGVLVKKSEEKVAKKLSSDEAKKKTVKDLLKEKREEANGGNSNSVKSISKSEANDNSDSTMKENKKPADSLKDVINSIAIGGEKSGEVIAVEKRTEDVSSNGKTNLPSSESENSRDSNSGKVPLFVELPENLPENILTLVSQIKEATGSNFDGSVKVYSDPVNKLLISFERKSKVLGKMSRSKIYQHLSHFMKVKKETLIRRTKKLVIEEDKKKLSILISELKANISNVMPDLLETYDRELRNVNQLKQSLNAEESKALRMPKRRFSWNEEIKKTLREIFFVKKRLLLLEGKTKENVEISLNLFIKSDIQVLWPEGWVTMATLLKLGTALSERKPIAPNSPSDEKPKVAQKPARDKPAPKEPAKKVISAEQAKNVVKSIGSKEIQKLSSNATLSITPITPGALPEPKPANVSSKEAIIINRIDTERVALPVLDIGKNSALSISPISSEKKETTLAKLETLTLNDKTTKFVSMIQNQLENPKNARPHTDHKIENIIKQKPSAENKPLIKAKPLSELKKPKADHPHSIDVLLPKPIKEVKKEDDVICIDDADALLNHLQRSKQSQLVADDKQQQQQHRREKVQKQKHQKYDVSKPKVDGGKNALLGRNFDRSRYGPLKTNGVLLGDSLLDNLLQENLVKSEDYYSSAKREQQKESSNRNCATAVGTSQGNKSLEGDDIQQVMENLKVLQKMSTPTKSSSNISGTSDTLSNSSAVSVIAFNKSYTPKSSPATSAPSSIKMETAAKNDFGPLNFQDVYQREIFNDLKIPFTKSYNTTTAHSSTSHTQQEKYYTNANNNNTQQNRDKYKSNYSNQGSFNLMDDMLANLISEYAYPKTANHKSKQPPK